MFVFILIVFLLLVCLHFVLSNLINMREVSLVRIDREHAQTKF